MSDRVDLFSESGSPAPGDPASTGSTDQAPSVPAPTAGRRSAPAPLVLLGLGLAAVALLVYGQNLGEFFKGGATAPAVYIDVAGFPARGSESAVVTLVEFSDYECPYCIRHFQTTAPLIDRDYIQSGRIRYVFRDFPIDDNHPQAIRAHEAAHCADQQHKFWDLHPRLFSHPGTHDRASLEARAVEAGLDLKAFQACVAGGGTTAGIRASVEQAERLGADGTPAFFIGLRDPATNRVRVTDTLSGAQPVSAFQDALDEALAQTGKK